jgi:hypothetical protein
MKDESGWFGLGLGKALAKRLNAAIERVAAWSRTLGEVSPLAEYRKHVAENRQALTDCEACSRYRPPQT